MLTPGYLISLARANLDHAFRTTIAVVTLYERLGQLAASAVQRCAANSSTAVLFEG